MSPPSSPVQFLRSCPKTNSWGLVVWNGMWEAGGQQVEACGSPHTWMAPSLRLSFSGRKETADMEVPTVQGREPLWGNCTRESIQTVSAGFQSVYMCSICAQPGEVWGVDIQPCEIRHCPLPES